MRFDGLRIELGMHRYAHSSGLGKKEPNRLTDMRPVLLTPANWVSTLRHDMEPFTAKPQYVELTPLAVIRARVPDADTWMAFDVDSLSPSTTYPGEWVVHVRDYRFGSDPAGMLGRPYQVFSLGPGEYTSV
jgi:hypothetical protein